MTLHDLAFACYGWTACNLVNLANLAINDLRVARKRRARTTKENAR